MICCNYSLLVIRTVLLRNNLTENAFGTRPERVPFAFHSRSNCVPFAFRLRSNCVPLLPERICGTRSGYIRIETGHGLVKHGLVKHRRKSSRVLVSVTFTFCVYTTVSSIKPHFYICFPVISHESKYNLHITYMYSICGQYSEAKQNTVS